MQIYKYILHTCIILMYKYKHYIALMYAIILLYRKPTAIIHYYFVIGYLLVLIALGE